MNKKELQSKAVDIKGKKYVLVADRVNYFNDNFPNGSIQTELVSNDSAVVIKAIITPDLKNSQRYFIAHSQAVKGEGYINKTSALENAETSAIGRALGFMGIGVIDSIASVDEINKAKTMPDTTPAKMTAKKNADIAKDTVATAAEEL